MCEGKAVPLQAWSGPEGSRKLRLPDFKTTAQDGGKIVSLTHRPPLPPGNASVTHVCYRLSRPLGHSAIGRILCQWKIPMTPAAIESATFRFVAQHLNHCATAIRHIYVLQLNLCMTSQLPVFIRAARCSELLLKVDLPCFGEFNILCILVKCR